MGADGLLSHAVLQSVPLASSLHSSHSLQTKLLNTLMHCREFVLTWSRSSFTPREGDALKPAKGTKLSFLFNKLFQIIDFCLSSVHVLCPSLEISVAALPGTTLLHHVSTLLVSRIHTGPNTASLINQETLNMKYSCVSPCSAALLNPAVKYNIKNKTDLQNGVLYLQWNNYYRFFYILHWGFCRNLFFLLHILIAFWGDSVLVKNTSTYRLEGLKFQYINS